MRKLRVSRPQASLCAGACVCVRAHQPTAGISVRGCLCVCARAPQLRVWPACAPAPDRQSLCAGRARSSSTLGFTTWRAVRRLTQVLRGRWAKRGELRTPFLLTNPDFSKMDVVKSYAHTIVAPAIDYWIKMINIKKGDEVALSKQLAYSIPFMLWSTRFPLMTLTI